LIWWASAELQPAWRDYMETFLDKISKLQIFFLLGLTSLPKNQYNGEKCRLFGMARVLYLSQGTGGVLE
jgi:hypothetical protein